VIPASSAFLPFPYAAISVISWILMAALSFLEASAELRRFQHLSLPSPSPGGAGALQRVLGKEPDFNVGL